MARLLVLALALFAGSSCLAASTSRITGGQDASISQYPFLAQIEFMGQFSGTWSQNCGGSILNSVYILSSANCFSGNLFQSNLRRVRVGTSERGSGGQVTTVEEVKNHPSFGSNGFEGDITVVRLAVPLLFGQNVAAGAIVGAGYALPDNQPISILGWGATSYEGEPSSTLQEAIVLSVSRETCRQRYQSLPIPSEITDNMFCTGILDIGGRDACKGDAGGPVIFGGVIVGVSSWGFRCGNGTLPGVNTAVSSYTNWIVSVAV